MARVKIKVVPEGAPNADGVWIPRKVPRWILRENFGVLWPELQKRAPRGMRVVSYRQTFRRWML